MRFLPTPPVVSSSCGCDATHEPKPHRCSGHTIEMLEAQVAHLTSMCEQAEAAVNTALRYTTNSYHLQNYLRILDLVKGPMLSPLVTVPKETP